MKPLHGWTIHYVGKHEYLEQEDRIPKGITLFILRDVQDMPPFDEAEFQGRSPYMIESSTM